MLLEILEKLTGVFIIVYDGQHALKYTLGRAKNVVGPGVHFKWPIVQRYEIRDTRDTTLDLEPQTIQLRDDLVYDVGAKVVYQIVDLRKALIEVDNLVTGLQNRLTLAVQRVVKAQDRTTVRDFKALIAEVGAEMKPVEDEWGFKIREFGFSHFSPTPPTLEVTQLSLLVAEKLALYRKVREETRLREQSAVALISGAVVAVAPDGDVDEAPPAAAPPRPAASEPDGEAGTKE